MPKSRNRKDHKKKVTAYKKRVIDERRSFQNKMKTLFETKQQEELIKQINDNEINTETIDDLNVEDFKLDNF